MYTSSRKRPSRSLRFGFILCILLALPASVPAEGGAEGLVEIPEAQRAQLDRLDATAAWQSLSQAKSSPRRDEAGRLVPNPAGAANAAALRQLPERVQARVTAARPSLREAALQECLHTLAPGVAQALAKTVAGRAPKNKTFALAVARAGFVPATGSSAPDPGLASSLERVGDFLSSQPGVAEKFTLVTVKKETLDDVLRAIGAGSTDWVSTKGVFGGNKKVKLATISYPAEDVFVLVGSLAEESVNFYTVRYTLSWRVLQPRLQPDVAIASGQSATERMLHPTRGWVDAAAKPPAKP